MNRLEIVDFFNKEINGIKVKRLFNLSAFEKAAEIPKQMLTRVLNGNAKLYYLTDDNCQKITELLTKIINK